MKVINETNYSTRDLRKLFLAGLKHEGMDSKYYKIVVKYRRENGAYGYGSYNREWIQINLPKIQTNFPKNSHNGLVKQVARTFIHEICHNRGLKHKEMDYDAIDTSWSDGYVLRLKEEKPVEEKDLQIERFEHAKKMLNKHESRLKRQKHIVNKWKQKVKYYEKAIEKKAALKEKGE